MELQKLYYFVIAAQLQHFRQAAEHCMVAQPVLSRQIAALEQELGVELFQRVKRRVRLTQAGHEFLPYAKATLEAVQQGQQAMIEFRHGTAGLVRVGCAEPLAISFLPRMINLFNQQHPRTRVHVSVKGSDELMILVEQRVIDVGLLGVSSYQSAPSSLLVFQEVLRDQLHLIVSSRHHLAAEGKALALEDVLEEPLILLHEGFGLRRMVEHVFAMRGLPVQPLVEIDLVQGLIGFLREGVGISFLPPVLVQPSLRENDLVAIPLLNIDEWFIFGMVYRRFEPLPAEAAALVQTIGRAMQAQG
jgi:LysR family transcriptional regulator, cyn operon transcriptional activator